MDRRDGSRADEQELSAVAARLEYASVTDIVAWSVEQYGDELVVAASFQDCVLIDLATRVAPNIEIVFLDTQYHFAETIEFVARVRDLYGLNLRVVRPLIEPDRRYETDPDECCALRKIEPLARALSHRSAWITGVRRAQTPARATTPVVHLDRGRVKINPLARWTDADVAAYVRDHQLPEHPLVARGFASIGCWPCTRAIGPNESQRAGRWPGLDKTECGLHGAKWRESD
jgi:phosphoadenosine phosphosulfate reductase